MDMGTILGVTLALGGIVLGQFLEGGSLLQIIPADSRADRGRRNDRGYHDRLFSVLVSTSS